MLQIGGRRSFKILCGTKSLYCKGVPGNQCAKMQDAQKVP